MLLSSITRQHPSLQQSRSAPLLFIVSLFVAANEPDAARVFQVSFLPQFITPSAPYVPGRRDYRHFAGNGIVIRFAYSCRLRAALARRAWQARGRDSHQSHQCPVLSLSALVFFLKAPIGVPLIITAADAYLSKIRDRARQNALAKIQKIVHYCHVFIRLRAKPIGKQRASQANACRRNS